MAFSIEEAAPPLQELGLGLQRLTRGLGVPVKTVNMAEVELALETSGWASGTWCPWTHRMVDAGSDLPCALKSPLPWKGMLQQPLPGMGAEGRGWKVERWKQASANVGPGQLGQLEGTKELTERHTSGPCEFTRLRTNVNPTILFPRMNRN